MMMNVFSAVCLFLMSVVVPVDCFLPAPAPSGSPSSLLPRLALSSSSYVNDATTTTTTIEKKTSSSSSAAVNDLRQIAVTAAIAATVLFSGPVLPSFADGQTKEFKLPPIDFSDKSRCVLKSSSMGQANAARDRLYDLRQCQLAGSEAVGYDLSGVIMSQTDVSNANFAEAQFSKAYLHDSNFDGADFTNAIVDRASFAGSSLRGTVFTNAVLTGTSFDGADLTDTDFTEAYLGDFDIRGICRNPTLRGENPVTGTPTRASVGCSN